MCVAPFVGATGLALVTATRPMFWSCFYFFFCITACGGTLAPSECLYQSGKYTRVYPVVVSSRQVPCGDRDKVTRETSCGLIGDRELNADERSW